MQEEGEEKVEGVLSLPGRFGDIVVSEIREINPPCMAVNGMKKRA